VRGTNTFLPPDIAVQWAQPVPDGFHARASAIARRYAYVLLQSPVRPSVDAGRVGWVFYPLDGAAMLQAANSCWANTISPRSGLRLPGQVARQDAAAHRDHPHAIQHGRAARRLRALLLALRIRSQRLFAPHDPQHHGLPDCRRQGQPPQWIGEVLAARSRDAAAPTFSPDGLYFQGPVYDAHWGLPNRTAAYDWLP
jgi:tRNA pseudouridine38-40 synthase